MGNTPRHHEDNCGPAGRPAVVAPTPRPGRHRHHRAAAWAAASALGLAVALAGCSSDPAPGTGSPAAGASSPPPAAPASTGTSAPTQAGAQPSAGSNAAGSNAGGTGAEGTGASQAPSAVPGGGTSGPVPEASPGTPGAAAASAAGPIVSEQIVTSNGSKLKVGLHEMKVNGDVVTAVFTLENITPSGKEEWYGHMALLGGEGKKYPLNTWMIGSDGKRYLPGLDSEGNCACTSTANDMSMKPGDAVTGNATFAAPTGDTVTVVLGELATFKDVRIVR